ncbi:MAG: OB-fold nucleic acid binding domain-containing protein [Acidimicrobiales bacterium]
MTLKSRLRGLRTSAAELDLKSLRDFCSRHAGMVPIGEAQARQEVAVVGEISSLRIVPRAGSPSLEAAISDGTGCLVAVWTGRRQIAGISPGRRLVVAGRANPGSGDTRLYLYNPRYELL